MDNSSTWQHEKLKKEKEVVNFDCYLKKPFPIVVAEVELRKIVGTNHTAYDEGSWLEMLAALPWGGPVKTDSGLR